MITIERSEPAATNNEYAHVYDKMQVFREQKKCSRAKLLAAMSQSMYRVYGKECYQSNRCQQTQAALSV
jgi:tRNA/tmRNA/rRNA uracil-C5-methylase (TrmA/RlmC/RlmD family)